MQSSVLCSVRVNMMERRPLVAIGRKATDRIRDRAPPQRAASRCSNTIQEGGGAEAEQGEGRRARSMWKWRDWGLRQSGKPGQRRWNWSPPGRSERNWSPPGQSGRDWSPPGRSGRNRILGLKRIQQLFKWTLARYGHSKTAVSSQADHSRAIF